MKKVIFFDLDGTLIPSNSWFEFNRYFGMSETEDQTLLDWYSRNIITYEQWDDIIVKLIQEKNQCTKEKLADFVQTIAVRPDTISFIEACKKAGYITVMISGTMQQIAEAVRENIGADVSHTTSTIVFNEDGSFNTITNEKDEGPAKLRIFEKLCDEYGIDPTQTIYVGDSRNDLEIFQKTSRGILIGEKTILEPFAWKKVTTLSEITPFL